MADMVQWQQQRSFVHLRREVERIFRDEAVLMGQVWEAGWRRTLPPPALVFHEKQSHPVGHITCMAASFKPCPQLFQVFRPGIVIGAYGIVGAPMPMTVPGAPQVAVRVALFALLSAKS